MLHEDLLAQRNMAAQTAFCLQDIDPSFNHNSDRIFLSGLQFYARSWMHFFCQGGIRGNGLGRENPPWSSFPSRAISDKICGLGTGGTVLETRFKRGHKFRPSNRAREMLNRAWARRLLLLSSGLSLVMVVMIAVASNAAQSSSEKSGANDAQQPSSRVRTMLDLLSADEDCDCNDRKACVFPTEIESRGIRLFPGGGQGDISSNPNTWGSFDPVSKVPRLSCQDTVHHAHYTRYKLPKEGRKALESYCLSGECIAPTNRLLFVAIEGISRCEL
jgi:hypothetical protein